LRNILARCGNIQKSRAQNGYKLLEFADVKFWLTVLKSVWEYTWCTDEHIGNLLAKICSNLINILDGASLSELAQWLDPKFISVQAAIELLAVAAKVAPDTGSAPKLN